MLAICNMAANVLYVSPNGNASWSGNLAAPNAAGTDGPLPSLDAARDAIRRLRSKSDESVTFTVVLRGGTYHLEKPFTLGPEDSSVTYEAAAGERAVISGGREISGWTRGPDENVWKARIAKGWTPRQLFVDSHRARRARSPNYGYWRISGPSSEEVPFRLRFGRGEIRKDWERANVEVVALLGWTSFRRFIMTVDESSGGAILSGGPGGSAVGIVKDPEGRYFIENAAESLDEPDEWYFDSAASTLSYWPIDKSNPNKSRVTSPVLDHLVILEGKAAKPVHGVVFRDLHFQHADWSLPPEGYADEPQAAVNVGAAIEADWAEDCVIERCSFSQIGEYAIWFRRGATKNRLAHNEIFDAGAGGIKLGETAIRAPEEGRTSTNTITDNHIHDLGKVHPEAVGIWLGQTGQNLIVHNLIHHVYYSGISTGWTWGYGPTLCEENRIEFNDVHDIGRDVLNDLGGIYTLGCRGGTVRNNIVHDVRSFAGRGRGIYLDEGTTGMLVEANIVYRAKGSGFHLHYGKENIVRNNIFALNEEAQSSRARSEPHLSFSFDRNIVVWRGGRAVGGTWEPGIMSEGNLYFNYEAGQPRIGPYALPEWQQHGREHNSIVHDPLFADLPRDDFRLLPNSPAWRLGFQAIDTGTVGPRP